MYRSKSQFQFLARLMALVMLLSQGVFAFASISAPMSHSVDMVPATDKACHTTAMDQDKHASMAKQNKSCQQDCCDKNDCTSHCQTCVTMVAGALIPAMSLLYSVNYNQITQIKSDQSPSGSDPALLDRPPRTSI